MLTWPDNLPGAWYYADMQEATNSHDYEWAGEDSERVEDWTREAARARLGRPGAGAGADAHERPRRGGYGLRENIGPDGR